MLTLPLEATVRPPPEVKELIKFLQGLCLLPELPTTEEHFLPSTATYPELSKRVKGKIRTWTSSDNRAESRAQQANEAKTVVRSFQRRLEDVLDEHSEAISTMEQLITFMARMPEKVLYKLCHRYVAFDMVSADRHRWGRPAIMVPTAITMQFSLKPPVDLEDGSAFFTLYIFPMAVMRSVVTDITDFKAFIDGMPADAVPPMVHKAAADIAGMESAKAKSAVLSLAGQLLYALMVQPRHFFLAAFNASELDIALTTFSKAPFNSALIELNDLWAYIDSTKRILCALADRRPHLFRYLLQTEEQSVLAVHSLKLPKHIFCYGYRCLVAAFNWPLPIDIGTREGGEGALPYPSREQLRVIQQRVKAMRAFTVHMDPAYQRLFPNYVHAFTLDKLESRADLVKKQEIDYLAAVQ